MIKRAEFNLQSQNIKYWLLFFCIVGIYLLFIVPTLNHQGISWDEEVDLRITRAYLTPRGLVFGLPLDNSQTRLPMFTSALIYWILGVNNLLIARATSVLVGALALLAVYIFGKSRYSLPVGLLAAGILAISPFFLSYARVAFTDSDVYLACTLSWLLVTVSRVQEKPTVGRTAIAGLVFGLCISSKATALVILPAIWIALSTNQLSAQNEKTKEPFLSNESVSSKVVLLWGGWAVFVFLLGIYGGIKLNIDSYRLLIQLVHYVLVFLGWGVLMVWVYYFRHHTAGYLPLAFLLTGLGLLTFIIFPPDHLTNSSIIKSLFSRAENEMSLTAAFVIELAALHLLSIIFKSTFMLGIGLLIGAFLSLLDWRQAGLLPLLVLACYFAGLLILPLGQTFYSVPLLPILSLLAANLFMRIWLQYRKIAYTVALVVIGWWGLEMFQSYPDFNLNGYQWLGARAIMGRSSIGYRGVVNTPSDGVQQAVEWLNSNAEPGQVAHLYIAPWHIVRHLAPDPHYQFINGFEKPLQSLPDYVVLHINMLIQSGDGRETPVGEIIQYPIDQELLEREYEKVFSVERAFDLEMVSIWRLKELAKIQVKDNICLRITDMCSVE